MKDTSYLRLLELLADGNWHLGDELATVSYRFATYIHRAKKRGLKFERKRIQYKYAYRISSPQSEIKLVMQLVESDKVGRRPRKKR